MRGLLAVTVLSLLSLSAFSAVLQSGVHFPSGIQISSDETVPCTAGEIGTLMYNSTTNDMSVCTSSGTWNVVLHGVKDENGTVIIPGGISQRSAGERQASMNSQYCNSNGVASAHTSETGEIVWECRCYENAIEGFYTGEWCADCMAGWVVDSVGACVLSDSDSDYIPDVSDNCLSVPNYNQADADSDGVGDVCDSCVYVANANQADGDSDGVGDVCDVCPSISNPAQEDEDEDSVGDLCDVCISIYDPDQTDSDSNGIGDACEHVPLLGYVDIESVETLTDFQVAMDLPLSMGIENDLSNLVIMDETQSTAVPWFSTGVSSTTASVLVRVPNLSPSAATRLAIVADPSLSLHTGTRNNASAVYDFYDDFEDGDASDWQIGDGAWQIHSSPTFGGSQYSFGRKDNPTGQSGLEAIALSLSFSATYSYAYESKMYLINDGGSYHHAGVLWSAVDIVNYEFFYMRSHGNNMALGTCVNDNYFGGGQYGNYPVSAPQGTWLDVRIEVEEGTRVRVYVEDVLIHSIATMHVGGGHTVGVTDYGSYGTDEKSVVFDNLRVRQISPNGNVPTVTILPPETDLIDILRVQSHMDTAAESMRYAFDVTLSTASLLFENANLRADFRNLRFVDANALSGTSECSYYVDDVRSTASTTAVVSVQCPTLHRGTTYLKVFVGNASEVSTFLDPAQVFEFYDNFDDGDVSDWTEGRGQWGLTTSFAVSGTHSYGRNDAPTARPLETLATAYVAPAAYTLESYMYMVNDGGAHHHAGLAWSAADTDNYRSVYFRSHSQATTVGYVHGGSWISTNSEATVSTAQNTWHHFSVTVFPGGSDISCSQNGATLCDDTAGGGTPPLCNSNGAVADSEFCGYFGNGVETCGVGRVGLHDFGYYGSDEKGAYWDDIRVRPYSVNAPRVVE